LLLPASLELLLFGTYLLAGYVAGNSAATPEVYAATYLDKKRGSGVQGGTIPGGHPTP